MRRARGLTPTKVRRLKEQLQRGNAAIAAKDAAIAAKDKTNNRGETYGRMRAGEDSGVHVVTDA